MATDDPARTRARRERSVRYPGVSLAVAVEFCRKLEAKGLDGLGAESIAAGLGFGNIKTNTFSAPLSAARQFGLLVLADDGYALTPLARSIVHPIGPAALPRAYREALGSPPLYADLLARLADRRVPEAPALANLLYNQFQITSSAKLGAAEAFLESARFAGVLDAEGILRTGEPAPEPDPSPPSPPAPVPGGASPGPRSPGPAAGSVRIDLRLWGDDAGKVIKVLAPESITVASFDRLIQALRLHLRIEDGQPDGPR